MNIGIIASGSTKIEYWTKEWGLSFLIDDDVLFDTYCHAQPFKNNFDLKKIKHVVISHEHWDHTGGLWWILENRKDINVYICSRFSADFKRRVKGYGCNLVEITKSICIRDNIFTSGEIEGVYNNRPVYEQSLILKEQDKIAVLTGCSHPGILKILTIIGLEHRNQIDLLSGGLHLMDKSTEEVNQIATMLDSTYRIKNIAPFHCTGSKAIKYFKKHMPQRFVSISTGDCFYYNSQLSSWELKKRGGK